MPRLSGLTDCWSYQSESRYTHAPTRLGLLDVGGKYPPFPVTVNCFSLEGSAAMLLCLYQSFRRRYITPQCGER